MLQRRGQRTKVKGHVIGRSKWALKKVASGYKAIKGPILFTFHLGNECHVSVMIINLYCCCSAYAIDHTPTYTGGAFKISSQRTRASVSPSQSPYKSAVFIAHLCSNGSKWILRLHRLLWPGRDLCGRLLKRRKSTRMKLCCNLSSIPTRSSAGVYC